MTPDEVLAMLPSSSTYRAVLAGLGAATPDAKEAAKKALRSLSKPMWETPTAVSVDEAVAVLSAIFDVEWPAGSASFDKAELAFTLVGSAHPLVIDRVVERFGDADDDLRLNLLTLVASSGTRQGAEAIASMVKAHGWPTSFHQRFFMELGKLVDHADALFPALLDAPGGPTMDIGNLLLEALRAKKLDPERVRDTPLVKELRSQLDRLKASLANGNEDEDDEDDERANAGRELAMHLDLAGFVGGDAVLPALRACTDLSDSWPAAFAVASLVRRGETVRDESIARIAADRSTLDALYSLLRDLGAADRIPAEHRSRDAFAAADMIGWLSHPGELGHPPAALERMAVFRGKEEGGEVELYVWRFRSKKSDSKWQAALSGPYPVSAEEGPVQGESTFSRFESWTSRTAEEHASAILKNLGEWHRAWAAEGR